MLLNSPTLLMYKGVGVFFSPYLHPSLLYEKPLVLRIPKGSLYELGFVSSSLLHGWCRLLYCIASAWIDKRESRSLEPFAFVILPLYHSPNTPTTLESEKVSVPGTVRWHRIMLTPSFYRCKWCRYMFIPTDTPLPTDPQRYADRPTKYVYWPTIQC
jgi:hypothetical protein